MNDSTAGAGPLKGHPMPSHPLFSRRSALAIFSASAAAVFAAGCRRAHAAGSDAGASLPRMAPRDLAARLDEVRDGKLDVLHVGPLYLYGKARIPHARHAGEASTAEGYAAIVAELRKLAPTREVVLYCGCCPTQNCPNIVPTERAARDVGLKRAFVLDLPTTLKADWTEHGYPVEKG
jgi:thiosulfate/3-mercaptopyruvate sulfurtransferase